MAQSEHADTVPGWDEAWAAAMQGQESGGLPIGAAVVRTADHEVLAAGHNRHVQDNDHTAHAEIVTLRQLGDLTLADFRETFLVSTAIPCWMCSGAIIHLGIPRVVAGLATAEGVPKMASHRLLESVGIEVVDLGRTEVMETMLAYMATHDDWAEDMGTVIQDVDLSAVLTKD